MNTIVELFQKYQFEESVNLNKTIKDSLIQIKEEQGEEEYLNIVEEELIELLLELQKSKRKKRVIDLDEVSKEMADVFISLNILLLLFPKLEDKIIDDIHSKIHRANYRLKFDKKNL